MNWRSRQPQLGIAVGLGLVVCVLPMYVSSENRSVLGRWSPMYVAAMVSLSLVWLGALTAVLRLRRTTDERHALGRALAGWGSAIWGLGYCWAALVEPGNAARLLEADIAGSTLFPSAALEWIGSSLVIGGIFVLLWLRVPERLRGPLTLLTTLTVLAVLAEGGARAKAFLLPATHGFPTHSEAVWISRFVDRNEMGLRDVDHPEVPHGGTRRLAILGDSYAFGWGLENPSDRIGNQIALGLASNSDDEWVAINVAEFNTHTLQHREQLDLVLPFSPDLILLVYVFNDVDYLSQVTPVSPLATRGGGLVRRLHPGRLLFTNSYAFQEAYVRWRAIRASLAGGASRDPYEDPAILDRHLDDLAELVASAQASGATAVVVPFDIAVISSPTIDARYASFLQHLESRGITTCSLREAFAGEQYRELTVNDLDVHPNERAHALAAASATGCLEQILEREADAEGS